MPQPSTDLTPLPRSTSNGPLISAAVGMLVATALLGLLALRLRVDLKTELWIYVPAAAVAAIAVSTSMGWIFVEFGREHRRPRQLPLTMALIGLGVLLMLAAIIVIGLRTAGEYAV